MFSFLRSLLFTTTTSSSKTNVAEKKVDDSDNGVLDSLDSKLHQLEVEFLDNLKLACTKECRWIPSTSSSSTSSSSSSSDVVVVDSSSPFVVWTVRLNSFLESQCDKQLIHTLQSLLDSRAIERIHRLKSLDDDDAINKSSKQQHEVDSNRVVVKKQQWTTMLVGSILNMMRLRSLLAPLLNTVLAGSRSSSSSSSTVATNKQSTSANASVAVVADSDMMIRELHCDMLALKRNVMWTLVELLTAQKKFDQVLDLMCCIMLYDRKIRTMSMDDASTSLRESEQRWTDTLRLLDTVALLITDELSKRKLRRIRGDLAALVDGNISVAHSLYASKQYEACMMQILDLHQWILEDNTTDVLSDRHRVVGTLFRSAIRECLVMMAKPALASAFTSVCCASLRGVSMKTWNVDFLAQYAREQQLSLVIVEPAWQPEWPMNFNDDASSSESASDLVFVPRIDCWIFNTNNNGANCNVYIPLRLFFSSRQQATTNGIEQQYDEFIREMPAQQFDSSVASEISKRTSTSGNTNTNTVAILCTVPALRQRIEQHFTSTMTHCKCISASMMLDVTDPNVRVSQSAIQVE